MALPHEQIPGAFSLGQGNGVRVRCSQIVSAGVLGIERAGTGSSHARAFRHNH